MLLVLGWGSDLASKPFAQVSRRPADLTGNILDTAPAMRDGGEPPRLGELGREGGVAPGKPQEDALDGVDAARSQRSPLRPMRFR